MTIKTHLMFGRTVDKPMSGDGISKMYKVFLNETSVSSSKKAHLARRTVPPIMEDMGSVAIQLIPTSVVHPLLSFLIG